MNCANGGYNYERARVWCVGRHKCDIGWYRNCYTTTTDTDNTLFSDNNHWVTCDVDPPDCKWVWIALCRCALACGDW